MLHLILTASLPLATAGILAGIARRSSTVSQMELELDENLQHELCSLASDRSWTQGTDDEAWVVVQSLGGRTYLLSQARLMLALTVETAKSGNTSAALQMEAHFNRLAILLRRNWKTVLMPQAHAHLCVDIYAQMCTLWEELRDTSCLRTV